MIYAEEKKNALNMHFPSKECFIYDSIVLTKKFLMKYSIPGVELIIVEKVMSELLINALKHGNKKNADKKIFCKIENVSGNQLKISVQDEGNGFNHDPLERGTAKFTISGYSLVKSMCNQIKFNEKRNCVTVFLTVFKPMTIFM